jgi:hypothetical protein
LLSIALVAASHLYAAPQEGVSVAAPNASAHRALLNRYCVTCHNERLRTAELTLDKMDVENITAGAEVWERVVRKLRAGQMPPAGLPRPDKLAYDSFTSYLETNLDRAAETNPNPGTPSIHRLNRAEYANAIRDLLALEIEGEMLLPPDNAGNGFDNIADVLSVSPLLMERYMQAARRISRLAIGDPAIRPAAQTYSAPEHLLQDDRTNEALPFGSRGGIAVRHHFPLDGEYIIRIRLQRNEDGFVRGLSEPHQLDVRLGGASLKLFTVGGERNGKSGPVYSVDLAYYRGDPEQVGYEYTADEGLEVRFPAKAGTSVVGVAFLKKTASAREGVLRPRPMFVDISKSKGGEPAVDSLTIVGPYSAQGPGETPSRRKIFVCLPSGSQEEEPCARQILSKLARGAYRRPVTDDEIRDLLSLYRSGQEQGGFETGIQRALHRILAGPEFLFRAESDPANIAPNTAYRVGDLELASRLAFFLWSSIPDEELLDLAERGSLRNPAILEQQVRRMLADSRSEALVSNFAGQWLYLRNLRTVSPDPREFPDFDDNLREAFQQETKLWFESMLREDRSMVDLLNADYTFVNERLALHYGIPNVYGSHFRRAAITDEHRKGLLGQGSVLTVTSYPNRTSPVLRGKWILENLLGTPPPPPPPDVVSELKENKEGKALTMRQQMEQHRANPACASCHKLMDPIGFALENFDAVAKWRTVYRRGESVAPIDTAGELYDGSKFQDVVELRQLLLSHRGQFVRTVTEKLLTYALGRGVEYYDAPAVRRILREAAPNDYRWSSIILGIVRSVPFQMRRSRES